MELETMTMDVGRTPESKGPQAGGPTPSAAPANRVSSPPPNADATQRSHRIQKLIETIDALPDPNARSLFQECFQSLLALYGDGLARILQLTRNAGADGLKVMDALVRDKFVRSLLLIHNLHPQSLEIRLRGALDKIRPYLQSHGGNVELVSLENDVAHLRLQGTCKSCPSSSVTLELAVRQAIEEACPDLMGFEVEGVGSSQNSGMQNASSAIRWETIDGAESLAEGKIRAVGVNGETVVVCRVGQNFYAFENRCGSCNASLHDGKLDGGLLRCPSGHIFDVRQAGVCSDNPRVHLQPRPLLASDGIVKIAVKH